MKRALTGFDVEVMIETNRWGNPVMREVSIGGVALQEAPARALWMSLPVSLRAKLYDDAMLDAEDPGDDDASSDEARMPGAAE